MAYHRTRGAVLRCIDFSESSQVASILTPDLGQVHVLAKGSRRLRKDARGPLDALSSIDLVIARRPAGQLHIAAEWTLRENFSRLRHDLRRLWTASYADEIVLLTTTENPDDGPLCDQFLDFLRRLNAGENEDISLIRFLSAAMRTLGSLPVTDRCTQCEGPLEGPTRFSPASGGGLCGNCGASDPSAFPISRGALAIMHRLASRASDIPALRIAPAQAREIGRAFNEQIQYHLGRPLRTHRFLVGAT